MDISNEVLTNPSDRRLIGNPKRSKNIIKTLDHKHARNKIGEDSLVSHQFSRLNSDRKFASSPIKRPNIKVNGIMVRQDEERRTAGANGAKGQNRTAYYYN